MALPALSGPSSHDGFLRRHQQHCIWELLQTQMFASLQKLRFASFTTSLKCHLPQRPSLAVAKIAISQSLLTSCPSCLSFSCIIYWHKIHLTFSSYYTGCLSHGNVTRQHCLLTLLCCISMSTILTDKGREWLRKCINNNSGFLDQISNDNKKCNALWWTHFCVIAFSMSGLVHRDRPKLGPVATACNSIALLHHKERQIPANRSLVTKTHLPSGYLHLTIRQTIKPLPCIWYMYLQT